MIVPHDKLSPDALDAVIEEFVSRDGTETSETTVKATADATLDADVSNKVIADASSIFTDASKASG